MSSQYPFPGGGRLALVHGDQVKSREKALHSSRVNESFSISLKTMNSSFLSEKSVSFFADGV